MYRLNENIETRKSSCVIAKRRTARGIANTPCLVQRLGYHPPSQPPSCRAVGVPPVLSGGGGTSCSVWGRDTPVLSRGTVIRTEVPLPETGVGRTGPEVMARSHCTGPGQVQGTGPGSMGFSMLCLLFTLC